MKDLIPEAWKKLIQADFDENNFLNLQNQVQAAYQNSQVFPPINLLFQVFNLCPPENLKVVIIGQDPYHGAGQAHGLSFSVNVGVRQPPSLKNIFKELKTDIPNFETPISGNLSKWANQGVLLLNAILSVESGKPGSHKNFGWEKFTDGVIKSISDNKSHVVFLLWGNFAISKAPLIDAQKHLVLTAAHPSPLARGKFFGSKHFSQTNEYLLKNRISAIDWSLA